jgi:hypothetical protein
LRQVVEQLLAILDEPQVFAQARLFESVVDEHAVIRIIIRA